MSKEIWRDIPNYELFYQVSNFGRIKSLPRKILKSDNKHQTLKGVVLTPVLTNRYHIVSLSKCGVRKTYRVHRLVALTFIPNPENKPQINHRDFITTNNAIDNLEWCTASENALHSVKYNKNRNYYREHNHKLKKKVVQLSLNNVVIKVWESLYSIQKTLNIHKSNVGKVCKGKQHTAGGFKWKYIT
jgi:hypothetical protein